MLVRGGINRQRERRIVRDQDDIVDVKSRLRRAARFLPDQSADRRDLKRPDRNIDRGPSSAQVIERLRTYRRAGIEPVFILGNHEEVLLRILGGDSSLIRSWLQFGGLECLQSYGIEPTQLRGHSEDALIDLARAAIPAAHVRFLESFVDSCRFGDYLFVHAGIRPGVDLEQQSQADLRWIREPFLFDETDHGFIVVHGHTISSEVEERPNRIGIDTGAYRTGVLTALALEGTERWYLDTREMAEAVPSAG